MRRVGSAPLDGGIVPGGVPDILGVQLPGVQGRLLHEARLAHPGVEEAVDILANLRVDAVIIGDDAVGHAPLIPAGEVIHGSAGGGGSTISGILIGYGCTSGSRVKSETKIVGSNRKCRNRRQSSGAMNDSSRCSPM